MQIIFASTRLKRSKVVSHTEKCGLSCGAFVSLASTEKCRQNESLCKQHILKKRPNTSPNIHFFSVKIHSLQRMDVSHKSQRCLFLFCTASIAGGELATDLNGKHS